MKKYLVVLIVFGLVFISRIPLHAVDDFRLAVRGDGAVGREGRQHAFMGEVLAPGFELLRRPAELFGKRSQRFPEAMRVEVPACGTRCGTGDLDRSKSLILLKRATGFEPATFSLGS